VRYPLRNKSDNPLNYREIVQLYGSSTLQEIRAIQKDLIQVGEKYKANLEASRQRLLEDIIPFIEKIKEITLPCNISASITKTPTRVLEVGLDVV